MIKFNVFQNNKELKSVQNKGFLLKEFNELLVDNSKKIKSYKTNLYSNSGQTPIIDQGSKKISGYTDDRIEDFSCYPAIIFGDHTRIIKYIDFPFFRGADGTKVLNTTSNEYEIKYFYYYLNYIEVPDDGYSRHFKYLKEVVFPIPKLSVQRKIVMILDLASELIEKRKDQIAEMDKLIQSVFYEMFGDPNKLSKEWKVNLKEVANITTGNTPSRKELKNYGNHMEWIKTDNMSFDSLYPSRAAEYLSEIGVNKARIADKKSILMTCIAGSKKSIGKVVLLDRAVAFNQQINSITVNDNIHVKYLFYTLKFSKVRLEDFANDSMKKMITKSKLETFEINNVDMKRQLEFTSIVEEIESQKKVMEESLREMENNFSALMQKAFRGELFPEE